MDIAAVNTSYEVQDFSTEEPRGVSRVWNWIRSNGDTVLRGTLAAVSVVGATVLGALAARDFMSSPRYRGERAVTYGAGFGICGTFFATAVLRNGGLANWAANWSYELLHLLTQFYLNAGCPVDGRGFWDDRRSAPLPVRRAATIGFSALSTTFTLLSVRPLLEFPQESSLATSRRLQLLESGEGDLKLFVIEQVAKTAIATLSLLLYSKGVVPAVELLYLSYYLFGNVGGTVFSKVYLFAKEHFFQRHQNPRLEHVVDKIERLAELITLGAFFAWVDDASFILTGIVSGITKMVALHRFERLAANDEEVVPFQVMRVDNVAKGFFLALFATWYVSGMAVGGLRAIDYTNISTFLVSSLLSYPLTRYVAANFEPGTNSRLFNSLRFYFVNYQEALVFPFMLIRSGQALGDIDQREGVAATIRELVAWASLGLASGNNRALQGIRSRRSPQPVSELALLISWFILTSGGRLR